MAISCPFWFDAYQTPSLSILCLNQPGKRTGIFPSMSVLENLSMAALIHKNGIKPLFRREEIRETVAAADRLKISMASPDQAVNTLSGGNQQKVLLAKWLAISPDILLLDEPTRGIDVGAKHDIYLLLSQLTREGKSIIMTSSELTELTSLADRILVLREGKKADLLENSRICREAILKAAANG